MSNDNFVEQLKERAKKYYAGCTYCQNISGDLVGFIVAETARHLKPIKHKNPPRDKFDEGADAARSCMTYDCDELIKQAEGENKLKFF